MLSSRMLLSVLVLMSAPAIALAQNKDNKALQQLKDTKQSSQDAAGTRNPEAAKAKSNKGFDTAQPPSVRAGAPSTQSKAERDAAAIKAYTSKPATGTTQIQAIQRKKLAEPPSPLTAATSPAKTTSTKTTPAKTAAPTTPAKIAAPTNPARPTAPVAAAPARPTPVAAAPARAAAPVAAAPVKPSTTTFTTSSAPSSSSSSSASKPSSSGSKK